MLIYILKITTAWRATPYTCTKHLLTATACYLKISYSGGCADHINRFGADEPLVCKQYQYPDLRNKTRCQR